MVFLKRVEFGPAPISSSSQLVNSAPRILVFSSDLHGSQARLTHRKSRASGTGETVWRFGVFAAFLEDPGVVPSTHVAAYDHLPL